MKIVLNGQPQEAAENMTVAELLQQLHLASRQVAIEVNEQLVPRRLHAEHRLCEGDRLEIVTLVGGG